GVIVHFLYHLGFEMWERRRAETTRTVGRRVVHAIGFQVALVTFLIPLIAWWLDVSLLQAFLYDAVLIVFFPIFTFAYNSSFDSVFGLPDAVTRKAEPIM
ncbi:PACE efflux transporter, partial [Burkholderia pseudomallei]|uniref:PACE efflux transporter n=1 Tax=Burkholderia pseudomallei TaxID=28450 RepID=UPI0021F6DDE2